MAIPFKANPHRYGSFLCVRGEDDLPAPGQNRKGCLICRFERHHDAAIRLQEQGHVGECLADGERFDVGSRGQVAFVRNQGQRLIGRGLERVVLNLFPNGGVNAVRVARAGRERIDDQHEMAT